jgi:hypothetical protein
MKSLVNNLFDRATVTRLAFQGLGMRPRYPRLTCIAGGSLS